MASSLAPPLQETAPRPRATPASQRRTGKRSRARSNAIQSANEDWHAASPARRGSCRKIKLPV
ncbi:hypothetical protein WOLCODRAFT_153622 [Wolfiporia cocos MD-104 SS10]|uniref:Uncharacterized protein n=1 Tax=Wolfiporia cocos (strain MD-104) TaxID=742152 RepID=A0A2H3JNV3_WOLCO|nr:hypothetical protein WOLCODRAFT_153622 [Wolfiporia cocos MD-104 SS10]